MDAALTEKQSAMGTNDGALTVNMHVPQGQKNQLESAIQAKASSDTALDNLQHARSEVPCRQTMKPSLQACFQCAATRPRSMRRHALH
eukprot:2406549-Amphidinium_carterae.1